MEFRDFRQICCKKSKRVTGFMGYWVYGFMGLWVYGFMGLWVYGFMGFWVIELEQ